MSKIRDYRTVNCTEGQKIESDLVLKRIGDISYRNMGSIVQNIVFDDAKALVVGNGLRVEPSSGMTVNVPSGVVFQNAQDVVMMPCVQEEAQTITLDSATGVARTDIIEAKVISITNKDDTTQVATVASGSAVSITNETIKRDIRYYLSVRKRTGTTTPTAATVGTLTGTVDLSGTLDLSETYLLNLADGEDGSFQEIDLRGSTPEATTGAEIVANINAAVGRTMMSLGAGSVGVLSGVGTGKSSYFQIKPPATDSDKDALNVVFGVSIGGVYRYEYEGENEWFKLAEFDIGTATTTITSALIRNLDKKDTWSDATDVIVKSEKLITKNIAEWNAYDSSVTYDQWDVAFIGDDQFVSIKGSNNDNDPIMSPNYWKKAPTWDNLIEDFQEGRVKDSGCKNLHDYGSVDYENWFFIGYYQKNSTTYEAYGIHADGTTVTGDTDLEDILKIGESNEFFNLDVLAPDVLGTRNLLDTRACSRSVNDAEVTRGALGVRQEDQMQLTTGEVLQRANTTGSSNILESPTGAFSFDSTGTAIGTWESNVATQPSERVKFDSSESPNARTSATTAGETRGKVWSDGIPYFIVLNQV